MLKIMSMVTKIIFGKGKFNNLNEIMNQIFGTKNGYSVFLVDSIHQKTGLKNRLAVKPQDFLIDVDIFLHEPTTDQVDEIRDKILSKKNNQLAGR